MSMFDKKMYIETFSALHAADNTLDQIYQTATQKRSPNPSIIRHALILAAMLVLMASSAVLAAGGRIMGGWRHSASVRDVEDMGHVYPKQMGEYRLLDASPTSIHVAPEDSGWLTAWMKPNYTWMSLDYERSNGQLLSLSFGKTDDPLWAYCFDYDEASGGWLGAAKAHKTDDTTLDTNVLENDSLPTNVTKTIYKGCTIYLADRIMNTSSDSAPAQGNANGTLAEAHWVDSEIGICFAITAGPEELQDHSEESVSNEMQKEPVEVSDKIVENTPDGSSSSKTQNTSDGFSSNKTRATQKELLACAKSVIDHNR